jgi:hypothetical protein
MKTVTIKYRKVYYKNVEYTIDVPDNVDTDNVQQYVNDNEELWSDNIEDELHKIPYSDGNGINSDDGWTDIEEDTEYRYEVSNDDGTLIYGGHL